MEVKFLRSAKTRLLEIWDYTEQTWGEEQADDYIRALVGAIHQAAVERHRWRPVLDETLPGVYYMKHQRHFMFFREISAGAIGVISVLHEKMNIPRRLQKDAD